MGLAAVVELLACPHCAAALTLDHRVVRCSNGHAFDVARQGYVNLLPGPPPRHADTAAMVAARERFLAGGWYDVVAHAMAAAAAITPGKVVLDVGAGPGWYLDRLVRGWAGVRSLALDVSVPAVRRAARVAPAVVADTWGRLPVRDEVVDVVLNVFAPRNAAEFARVLRPGGRLVVTAAEPDHLAALRQRFGLLSVEQGKQHRLAESLADQFAILDSVRVTGRLVLPPDAVVDLIAMGPNAFHGQAPRPAGPVAADIGVRVTTATRV